MNPKDARALLWNCLGHVPKRVAHSCAVASHAVQIGRLLNERGHDLDLDTIETMALLHDVGHGLLTMKKGSIEEHALVELLLFDAMDERELGFGAARDFATHEGVAYELERGAPEKQRLPLSDAGRTELRRVGALDPSEPTESLDYLRLFERLGLTPEDCVQGGTFLPRTLEEQVVGYADLHHQQGQPADGESPDDHVTVHLKIAGRPTQTWWVAVGSFPERVAEIQERFKDASDPNDVKIAHCVTQSTARLTDMLATVNDALGHAPDGYIGPEELVLTFEA